MSDTNTECVTCYGTELELRLRQYETKPEASQERLVLVSGYDLMCLNCFSWQDTKGER